MLENGISFIIILWMIMMKRLKAARDYQYILVLTQTMIWKLSSISDVSLNKDIILQKDIGQCRVPKR